MEQMTGFTLPFSQANPETPYSLEYAELVQPLRFPVAAGKGQGGIGSPGMVLQTPVEGAAGQPGPKP